MNESELKEILAIAHEGESKLKEMSDYASRSLRIALQSCQKSGELKHRNLRIIIRKMIKRSPILDLVVFRYDAISYNSCLI